MKKPTLKSAKKSAWVECSKYVRISRIEKDGLCECVTCGVRLPWKEIQAGHYVDGRNNTVLFDLSLIHPQCYRCNVILKGNKIKYTLYMKKTYGYTDKEIDELDNLKLVSKKIPITDILDLRDKFKSMNEELMRIKKL